MPRAYNALTFDEEKHAVLGMAHLALAALHRKDHLRGAEDQKNEYEKARKVLDSLDQELDQNLREEASEQILDDKSVMLLAMQVCGHAFGRCSRALRDDPEVVLAAACCYPPALEDAGNAILSDRGTMLEAVRANGWCLAYASPGLQDDKEVVKAAVESCPRALEYASAAMKADREVVLAAVEMEAAEVAAGSQIGASVLARASADLQQDPELVLEAVRACGTAFGLAALELRQSKDFLLRAMRRAPRGHGLLCYCKAHSSLQQWHTLEDCQEAADSVLAVADDIAPVLTITLRLLQDGSKQERARGTCSCEVALLSGVTFACDLPSPAAAGDVEPETQESDVGMTVGQLAQLVLMDLPNHVQIEPPPERAFIVLMKPGDLEGIAATPWDSDRSLSDFV